MIALTITHFNDQHNHELIPRKQSYLLRSCRALTAASKSFIESLESKGLGVSASYKLIENECGGPQNVGFTRQDAYNHLKSAKRYTRVENYDATNLIQFLIDKAYNERYFFWKVHMDDDGRIMNVFFRDSRCSHDYKAFGDVISIDTTYPNMYNLICAPFTGVNHHLINVMFGIPFLSDETTMTFEWLFKAFLESMGGVQPKLIFTDQCVPMMNGIDKVCPDAKHRLCQWHINKNASSHFGNLSGCIPFKKMWHTCMNGVEDEAEFEELWSNMIKTYNLPNINWFTTMYNLRHRWASVFSQEIFSAGLHATSRSESTNRALKMLNKSTTTLLEFVQNFELMVAKWRAKELEADTLGLWQTSVMVDNNLLLCEAAAAYTRTVYKSFEYEFTRAMGVVLVDDRHDMGDGNVLFLATTTFASRPRSVIFNMNSDVTSCSCKMWETDGIFCRHILKVYSVMNVFAIPQSQIVKRWCKVAKGNCSAVETLEDPRPSTPYLQFVNDLIRNVYEIAGTAIDSPEARKIIKDSIESLRKDVIDVLGNPDNLSKKRRVGRDIGSASNWDAFRDPMPVKERGWVLA